MGDQAESVNLLGKEQMSSLNQFTVNMKTIFYEYLYTILRNDDQSILINFSLTLIQYFQIYYFAFHPAVISIWNQSNASKISSAFGFPGIIHIYRSTSVMVYQAFFYIAMITVILFFFIFLYSFITLARQRTVGTLLLNIQQLIINCFLTILYVPFMDIFISFLNCESVNGVLSLNIYSSIQCWNGMHIFYATGSIIALVILEIFSYVFSILYFDGIQNDQKVNSVKNSRHVICIHIVQFILVLTYNFMNTQQYNGVLNTIYFVCALLVFYMIHSRLPFNHPIVQRYQSLFCTVFVWTAMMMALAQLTEKTVFQGLMYAWAIGLPLIIFTVFWIPLEKNRKDFTMNVNTNKFSSPEEVIEHANYVQKLIRNDMKKTSTSHLLNGYIEFHNKTCLNSACPLKKIKFSQNSQKKNSGKVLQNKQQASNNIFNQKKQDKRYLFCYEMISKLFEAAIATYPQDVSLRIQYSIFLMKVMKSKQHAINEVVEAENLKCSIDDRFTLYYIKRNIENEINEMSKETNGEYTEQRNLEGKIQHFRAAMEQTVTLLMEFWSQFSDDKPDLIKLYDIGSKLFPLKLLVDEMWKKISRTKGEQIPKLLRIYSKYLLDIFNDKKQGMELLEKAAKLENSYHNKKDLSVNYASDLNIDGQEDGMIFMTMEEDKIGQILTLNLSCSSMFGYSKTELLNKNVNILMPQIYQKHHEDILKRYVETNESTFINKDKQVYGKNKSGYIFPVIIHIKPIFHALKDGMEFLGIFRKEKNVKNFAYALATYDNQIRDISSSCLNILGIDHKTISLQTVNLQNIITDILSEKEQYMQKVGKQKEYTFPKISEDQVIFNKGSLTVKLNVWLQEVSFKVKSNAGYILKVESVQKKANKPQESQLNQQSKMNRTKQKNLNTSQNVIRQQDNLQKEVSFLFKLVIEDYSIQYEGEYIEGVKGDNPNNLNNTAQFNDTEQESNLNSNNPYSNNSHIVMNKQSAIFSRQDQDNYDKSNNLLQEAISNKVDYGLGIKIMRLKGNVIVDIDRDMTDEEQSEQENKSENEENEKQARMNKNRVEEYGHEYEGGSNQMKELNQELQKQSESTVVSTLKNFSVFVILTMIAISIIDFVVKNSSINSQSSNFTLIKQTANRISDLNLIISDILELTYLQAGVRDPQFNSVSQNPTIQSDTDFLKNSIQNTIQEYENLTISIQNNGNTDTSNTKIYFDQSFVPSTFQVSQASQQMISKSHNIVQLDISQILQTQSDVFFVIFNGLNDYINQLTLSYYDIAQKQSSEISNIQNKSLIYLIVSISAMVVFSIILTIFLGRTIFAKQLILSVFLEIPEKTAKYLYSKCENFLAQLGSGEEEEVHSEVDLFIEDKELNDEGKTTLFGKRKKKFKNSDNGSIGFLIKMLIIAVIVEVYFVVNYILGGNQIVVINGLLLEYNTTCFALGYYSQVSNSEKQLIYNSNWNLLNSNSQQTVSTMLNNLYTVDSLIHEEHASNTEYHQVEGSYLSIFESVMFQDACVVLLAQQAVSQSVCTNFSNGIVQQGMIAVVIRYFQLLRYQYDKYTWIITNPNQAYPYNYTSTDPNWVVKSISQNVTLNNLYNLLRTPDTYELTLIQTLYIENAFKYLQDQFLHEFSLLLDNYKVQRILFLALFILLLITASITCWLPFLSNLNKEIWSTKCLLSFIPVDEVNKIRAISNFIKDYILERRI
ncbi:PAS domain S-box protein (macronuclear) [Tetrahymena thermophila SB210]|uniref:PAS domain S-box protein n=1 Tax=Tetrahymena thermophila (strain SB210) TaxID=312017 RepID=I7ML09_TETTS|nr:PAS domain S-box protein [Tetrahymena thermophila SB210]EAS00830.2 PAS domain S-box protein [Tetrahymena thermophila SB210]|eukprot:XP_001021075.2 PAS domain S-box protein [Tetrahymena thermophila SB210]